MTLKNLILFSEKEKGILDILNNLDESINFDVFENYGDILFSILKLFQN